MKHRDNERELLEERLAKRFDSEVELDIALRSKPQTRIASMVKSLPCEEPSMAWRSRLNEGIVRQRGRIQVQNKLKWMFAPVAGLGLAGLFAVLILTPQRLLMPGAKSVAIERSILDDHRDAVISRAVAGRGLVAQEARPTDRSGWNKDSWEESDIEAL